MVAVAVAIEGGEHDAEWSGPLAEEDEEVMPQRLLREEKAPVVDWTRCVCGDGGGHRGSKEETDLNVHLLSINLFD